MCISVRGCVDVSAGAYRRQKRAADPLGARIPGSCKPSDLGLETELGSSMKATGNF